MKITPLYFSLKSSSSTAMKHTLSSQIAAKSKSRSKSTKHPSSQPSSPYLKNSPNKRLKYFSTRNKECPSLLNQQNIEAIKQQFKKIHDKNPISFKQSNKRDLFNVIVKNYSKKISTSNQVNLKEISLRNIEKSQDQILSFSQRLNQQFEDRKIDQQFEDGKTDKQFEDGRPDKQFKDRKIDRIQTPDQQILQLKTEYQKQQIPIQFFSIQKQHPLQQSTKQTQRSYFHTKCSPISTKSKPVTILIPKQRLRRHRFNRSSMSQFSYSESQQNQINNQKKSLKNQTDFRFCQFLNSKQHHSVENLLYSNHTTRSRRFIKIPSGQQFISQVQNQINPYTQQRYLHVQIQKDKKAIKSIQKYLQHSVLQAQMLNSFVVKPIQPKPIHYTPSRVGKKYLNMKDNFLRKNRKFTTQNKKDKQENSSFKKKQNDFNGWDVETKLPDDQDII